jgi:hypothetical protein
LQRKSDIFGFGVEITDELYSTQIPSLKTPKQKKIAEYI